MEEVKIIDSKVCKEIYSVFNKLGFLDKLPDEIKKYITENQNTTYEFDFNEKKPLIEQIDNEETKAYISYLYLKYINDSESEKERLLKKYKENEIIYQEKLRKKNNPDNIFKNKKSL